MKYRKMIILTLTLLLLSSLAIIKVRAAKLYKECDSEDHIQRREHHLLHHALDLLGRLRPCLPDFQPDRAEIHLEYHRDLSQEERTIKSRIRTLLPDITDEAMVAWIVYVDEVGRHGCFTKILLR